MIRTPLVLTAMTAALALGGLLPAAALAAAPQPTVSAVSVVAPNDMGWQ
ncbi:hypothetical protein OG500_29060 [Kitasatospora sp. NBC_01250]|nr:hypothetical protein [Kitasatospora sp. NBC_01250]